MQSTWERTGSFDRFSFQVAVFGAFSAAWTAVAVLITGPRYDMGTQAVGLLALIGAASMFLASTAGRWGRPVRRRPGQPVVRACRCSRRRTIDGSTDRRIDGSACRDSRGRAVSSSAPGTLPPTE
jgi:hypothetical protein